MGICIPGIFISMFCGDADGDGFVCMFIPGMFICCEALGFVAVLFIPGMFAIGCFVVDDFLRAVCFFVTFFFLDEDLFFFAAGLLLLIPGMLCMSCPCDIPEICNEMISPITRHPATAIFLMEKLNCLMVPS